MIVVKFLRRQIARAWRHITTRRVVMVAALILIVSALFVSCAHSSNKETSTLPRTSFLFVLKNITFHICSDETGTCKTQEAPTAGGSGSGFVIANSGEDSIGITAGHMCTKDNMFAMLPMRKEHSVSVSIKINTLGGKEYSAVIEEVDKKNDICLIRIQGVKLPVAKFSAEAPKIGERVYSLAAPAGIYSPNMVPILTGFYSGRVDKWGLNMDAYTMPTTGGCSGAAIFNARGEVIGMTAMSHRRFETFGLSPIYPALKAMVIKAQRLAKPDEEKAASVMTCSPRTNLASVGGVCQMGPYKTLSLDLIPAIDVNPKDGDLSAGQKYDLMNYIKKMHANGTK